MMNLRYAMTRKDKLKKKIEGSDISEIFLVQIPQCVTALRRARRITTIQFDRKIILEKTTKIWFQNIFPTSIASSAAFCYPTIKNYLYNDDIHLPKNNKIIVIIMNFMSDLINPKPNHKVAKNFLKIAFEFSIPQIFHKFLFCFIKNFKNLYISWNNCWVSNLNATLKRLP